MFSIRILGVLLVLAGAAVSHAEEARLLRFPAIHGDQVVFTYAGDLYTVNSKGGIARRLTSHSGFEMFPKFSPDGKSIAFTGQYDGNTEIYKIPSSGGEPKRLTWTSTLGRDEVSDRMGPNNITLGWTPDGKDVLFRSRMTTFNDFLGQLYTVNANGGLHEELPLPRGGFASYSPDGSKIVYNRIFREFRTWKRYRGGMCDDIWTYDFKTKKTEQLVDTLDQEIEPMWFKDRIYFLSDRDVSKRMNLYVLNLATKAIKQVTNFADFDVKFPSLGDKAIAFEQAGFIWKLNLETDKYEKIPIELNEDFATSRIALLSVADKVASGTPSPDGKRVCLSARGELFTIPSGPGITRNFTNTPGAHDRDPHWSPDGKNIAFISDISGEDEIMLVASDAKSAPTALTTKGDVYKYSLFWSPDSKKILWTDRKFRVRYIDVATKQIIEVAQSKHWEINDAVWSPDSKWVSWSETSDTGMDKIRIYNLEKKVATDVTDGWHESNSPAFSGDGKFLFFVSNRDLNPIYSSTEWNHAYRDMARIYAVALAKDTPSPFKPKTDEPENKPAADAKDKDSKIDLTGFSERTFQIPTPPGNYRNLQSVGSAVWYIRSSSKEPRSIFATYDLATRAETNLGSVSSFDITADGKKTLVSVDGKFAVIDLPKASVTPSSFLDLSGMEVQLDRKAEWKQIYHECWRQMRDFFYDPNLHGVDWIALRNRYETLLPHVRHRADLSYVIGELIGELNAGHAYVGGGDLPAVRKIPLGQLGAKLEKHAPSGYVKITRILEGSTWEPGLASPLAAPGVNAKVGDYLIAIDNKPVNEMASPYQALVNKVGKPVVIKINSKPEANGAREVVIVPIDNEGPLYYRDWVEKNRKRIDEASKGKVGYIHVPDMMQAGLNEFARQFYPQLKKSALIIDMRGNGGGNVSPMLIERLRREIAMVGIARGTPPSVDPRGMMHGPMVCLMNEFSASDGDLFPYRFRQHKLGKLIGKRSWGGVIGIRGTLPLLDGGTLNKPEFSRYDIEGKEWIIEGKGVTPDIIVDNDPAIEYSGKDQQLERAIEEILNELKTKEKKLPPPPPFPKR